MRLPGRGADGRDGVFGYSDEDGTEAESFADKLDEDEIRARTEHVSSLVEELTAQRAAERIGEEVLVLVEDVTDGVVGRAEQQGPEVDGTTTLVGDRQRCSATWSVRSWWTPRASTWSRRSCDDRARAAGRRSATGTCRTP